MSDSAYTRGSGRGRARGGFRGRGRGRGRGGNHHQDDPQRLELRRVSYETKDLLPHILSLTTKYPPDGFLITPPEPLPLDPKDCPGFKDVKVRIVEKDSFDAAIEIGLSSSEEDLGHPLVLNMASDKNPGGGWLGTARAQEEALCRRSTLISTLDRSWYPLPPRSGGYSPSVIIFRTSVADGHQIIAGEPTIDGIDEQTVEKFHVVSVVSVAALRRPELAKRTVISAAQPGSPPISRVEERYKHPADRELMKDKLRVILRISVRHGHRRLVLGALGCGAFGNPKEEAAQCWVEVFNEPEFRGGWWKDVVFAVIDDRNPGKEGDGNVGIFARRLDGLVVGA